MSEGWFVHAVLLKYIIRLKNLCFLLKFCKFEYGWGKL